MRDITIDQLADKIRDVMITEHGMENVTPATIRYMTRVLFHYIEKVMQEDKGKLVLWKRDITQIFTPLDFEKLCDEYRAEPTKFVDYGRLIRKGKLSKMAAKFLKQKHHMRMKEEVLA